MSFREEERSTIREDTMKNGIMTHSVSNTQRVFGG
jgi:hypothetical protein